ncbi:MAG: hypothetical protein LBB90_09620 [Tannerella sp.]|nr:hypothetical protein [Tannerella sp.]
MPLFYLIDDELHNAVPYPAGTHRNVGCGDIFYRDVTFLPQPSDIWLRKHSFLLIYSWKIITLPPEIEKTGI